MLGVWSTPKLQALVYDILPLPEEGPEKRCSECGLPLYHPRYSPSAIRPYVYMCGWEDGCGSVWVWCAARNLHGIMTNKFLLFEVLMYACFVDLTCKMQCAHPRRSDLWRYRNQSLLLSLIKIASEQQGSRTCIYNSVVAYHGLAPSETSARRSSFKGRERAVTDRQSETGTNIMLDC